LISRAMAGNAASAVESIMPRVGSVRGAAGTRKSVSGKASRYSDMSSTRPKS
jgi:hypothetical protein